MHRHLVRFLWLILPLLSAAAYAQFAQDEFSADMYNSQNGKPLALEGRIYMARNKVRIDSQQPQARGVVIIDMATRTNIILMPERKMYVEMPQTQNFQRQAYDFFRPSDVSNACVDWQQLPMNRGITCRKLGNEAVNGRNTVRYEGTRPGQGTGYVWFDPALRFPVKWQDQNQFGELRNINVRSQPASLFEVPPGYQKMQVPAGRPGAMPPQRQHP